MQRLPPNIRVGRFGRIGILKKVPRDLWDHPLYRNHAKVIERSTGTTDAATGLQRARLLLAECEQQFARCREEMRDREISRRAVAPRPARPAVPRRRAQMSEQTRTDILAAGIREFSEKGLRGARIDDIAAQTEITKPAIYYHFGSKQKLYVAALEEAYAGMRRLEHDICLRHLPALEALRRLVEATFDHHAALPEFVRLIAVENTERARHIADHPSIARLNAVAIDTLREVLGRGEREGVFRAGLRAGEVHLLISSFCFFRVSNRYTWRALFDVDLWEPETAASQRRMIVEIVLRYVLAREDEADGDSK